MNGEVTDRFVVKRGSFDVARGVNAGGVGVNEEGTEDGFWGAVFVKPFRQKGFWPSHFVDGVVNAAYQRFLIQDRTEIVRNLRIPA